MGFQKIDFNQQFFSEFRKDPKNTFKRYGIDIQPSDAEFFKQDFQHISFDDFKIRLEKSRFFNFFDFAG